MIWDTFMLSDELDMLECRLYELESIPDLRHVVIEADVTHQDRKKPSHLRDNWERFAPWHDRIVPVWATGLPTARDFPDPWAREHAQREWAGEGLIDAAPDDVVLHGDVDEIPTVVAARNLRPGNGIMGLAQRGHFWAVDWLYPKPWSGTVATSAKNITSFAALRDVRNIVPKIPGGWHLSWLGGQDTAMRKVGNFCHPEVKSRIVEGLATDGFLKAGIHVDGEVMAPVDVDKTWPKYVYERRCPDNWFRPR